MSNEQCPLHAVHSMQQACMVNNTTEHGMVETGCSQAKLGAGLT